MTSVQGPSGSASSSSSSSHHPNHASAPLDHPSSRPNDEDQHLSGHAQGEMRNGGQGQGAAQQGPANAGGNKSGFTIRKTNRPALPSDGVPRPPPSALTPSPSQPLPPTTTTSTPSIPPSSSSSSSAGNAPTGGPPVFPALHLIPLNNTFVPKQVSLDPPGVKVKIGRQTNAKTVPNGTNGYFDSKVLSRAHAEVWSEEGKVFIKDVKSSNGTFINGERLSPESAESDVFELHTDDVVEFGIDILTDDTKTIVHHKVAAKVHLVMNSDDAVASSREFNNWYRQAGEQNLQHQQHAQQGGMGGGGPGGMGGPGTGGGGMAGRRPARAPVNAQNGLSFEHVLSRLQGELQKSRDTGSNLNDVNSTLCDVHDTLGGAAPRSTATTNGPLPYPTTSAFPPRPAPGPSNESIQALQQQLNDLASHVGRIRDLEGMLKEQEGVRDEVETLKRLMEENVRKELSRAEAGERRDLGREHESDGERERERSGRESPVARMLEKEEDEADEADDDDTRSIASVDTVVERLSPSKKTKQVNGGARAGPLPLESDDTTTEPLSNLASSDAPAAAEAAELARDRIALQEQNAALTARLDALSAELDEAIQLGRTLQAQHSEAYATIKVLEDKIASLETTVEDKVVAAQSRVMKECEDKWKSWKAVFEEGWNNEKQGWLEERDKLRQVVREWEERKKAEEADSGDSDEDDEENGSAAAAGTSSSSTRSTSPKKRSTRRRKRNTIVPNAPLASSSSSSTVASKSTGSDASLPRKLTGLARETLASDSDSTIGGNSSTEQGGGTRDGRSSSPSGASRGTQAAGQGATSQVRSLARSSSKVEAFGWSDALLDAVPSVQQGLPVSWAGAVVVIAVAVGYGAALKLKE
ncbi:hypothetical protein JCM10212_005347 [Sporobolomyces blumeae]